MTQDSKNWILNSVKEITVARMENIRSMIDVDDGKDVADFMQAIYDKLVALVDEKEI